MSCEDDDPIYKVLFMQNDKVYEIYSKYLSDESLYGFIEVEDLLFSPKTELIVDPSEERLKTEFKGVSRSYIPSHMVLRIDEVEKTGIAKISPAGERSVGNVTHLPTSRMKANINMEGDRSSDQDS